MWKLLPLLALCAACSPAEGNRAQGDQAHGDRAGLTATAAPGYGTQTHAPSPDYRALLAQPAPPAEPWRHREATSPLPPDAKAIGESWIGRLDARAALLGYGLAGKGPDGPVEMIDTGLTEAEFDRWVKDNGWHVPTHIRWSFVPEMRVPRVSPAAKGAIRVWPASTARTGVQPQALFHGRIELRDGCFFVGQFDQPVDKLAWFHAETGLDIDQAGYFILRDRVSGATLARVGEDMSWGGPASAHIDEQAARALQDACGPGEVYVVGSPEASERFLTQYPHLRNPQAPPPPPPVSN